jgi:hypothetical protein
MFIHCLQIICNHVKVAYWTFPLAVVPVIDLVVVLVIDLRGEHFSYSVRS